MERELNDHIIAFTRRSAAAVLLAIAIAITGSSSAIAQFELVNRYNIADNDTLNLNGARSVAAVEIENATFLYVVGSADSGISGFRISANGTLTNVINIQDTETLALRYAASLAAIDIEGRSYLYVAGSNDDGISAFAINNDGSLSNIQNVYDDSDLRLDSVSGITTSTIDGSNILFAAGGSEESGVSSFSISQNGLLSPLFSVSDDSSLLLNYTWDVHVVTTSGNSYLYASGFSDNGISIFRASSDGSLFHIGNVADDSVLNLTGATGLESLEIGGVGYLVAGGFHDQGISVFRIASDGMLTNVSNQRYGFFGTRSISPATIGDSTFLFVSGFLFDGIVAIQITSDGQLRTVQEVSDQGSLELDGATSTTTVTIDEQLFVIIAAEDDHGVSVFEADVTAPQILSIARQTPASASTNADALVFAIEFSEAVSNVSPEDFLVTGATATKYVSGSGSSYSLTLSGGNLGDFNGAVGVDLSPTQDIVDLAGIAVLPSEPVTDEIFVLDNLLPTAAITGPSGAVAGPFTVDIVFSEQVSDFEVNDLTVTNGVVTSLIGDGVTYSATVNPASEGYVTIRLAGGVVSDVAGNGNTGSIVLRILMNAENVSPTASDDSFSATGSLPPSLDSVEFAASRGVGFGWLLAAHNLPNGGFALAWWGEWGPPPRLSRFFRAFDADGVPFSAEVELPASTGRQSSLDFVPLSNGNLLFTTFESGNGGVTVSEYTTNGQLVSTLAQLSSPSEFASSPRIILLGEDHFVVAWRFGQADTYFQIFQQDGTPATEQVRVPDADGQFDLISIDDDSFAMARTQGGREIAFEIWNISGEIERPVLIIGTDLSTDTNDLGVTDISSVPGGRLIITTPRFGWIVTNEGHIIRDGFELPTRYHSSVSVIDDSALLIAGGATSPVAQFFDFEGDPIGDVFVPATSDRDILTLDRPGGDFLIAFNASGSDGRRPAFRLANLSPIFSNVISPLGVLANDIDPDGDSLSIVSVNGQSRQGLGPEITASLGITVDVALPSGATVSFSDTALHYDPRAASFAIELPGGSTATDSFIYSITDGYATASANVTVTLTGVNDPPSCAVRRITVDEDSGAADITAEVLTNAFDQDTGETALLRVNSIDTTNTKGSAELNSETGVVTYSPSGAFESLPLGMTQDRADEFFYTVRDPAGSVCQSSTIDFNIVGANDSPNAANDAFSIAEEALATDVTTTLLANDSDIDTGETAQLTVTAIDTSGTIGRVTLENGVVNYDPNGAFNHLSAGETAEDRFSYTITDPHGATSTAEVVVTINGYDGHLLTVETSGLGLGSVTSLPLGINCGGGGACDARFTQGSEVALVPLALTGTRFTGWGGDCLDFAAAFCAVRMSGNQTVRARFELASVPEGRIVAATLPGARSGYVGGPDITVFMSVVSRQTTPAQSCRVTAPGSPPFTLSYQRVGLGGAVEGDVNPLFDLGNGGSASFVLAMTPTAETGPGGYVFQPRIVCENAELAPIEGVNSVQVSIGAAPVPDILSIGATPSADGVVRIPDSGNRINFLSAAALNIGAGDGSAVTGQATVTASVDTGAAVLPVTLEVCETASTGGCITPRGVDSVTTVFDPNVVKFFAVFVRANEGANIPFDPANARVFLRFVDAGGLTRSATSAAISSPLPSDQPIAAIPAGRWSVLVRQDSGAWPSLRRASLYVFRDGAALLDDGETVTSLSFEGFATERDFARFDLAGIQGAANDNAIRAGDALGDQPGALWGVRDLRGDAPSAWSDVAGDHGTLRISADGSISGTLEGCIVSGSDNLADAGAPGLLGLGVTLMSCEHAGSYRAVIDMPANDNERPVLLMASGSNYIRVELQD